MKFLLKLKHWQLFLLTWGIPIILNGVTFSQPELLFQMLPLLMVFFTLGAIGWVWAIATELNHLLPSGIQLNSRKFKIYFSFPIVYIVGIILYITFLSNSSTNSKWLEVIMIGWFIMHILSIVLLFMGLRFAAKTMKSIELGRMAKFGDYAGEFFLIWFSILGHWVLQPRLNKLVKE